MQYVMIDLETLDVEPTAVVLSMGAVKFDPITGKLGDTLFYRVDVDEQLALSRTTSDKTMDWWAKQSPEAQESAFSPDDRHPLGFVLTQLHRFVWGSDRVWSQGSMDIDILKHMFRSEKMNLPWAYWQVMDSRTIFDAIDGHVVKGTPHDALSDAIGQAEGICRAYAKIGYNGRPV